MSVNHDNFWTKPQVKFFSQEIMPENEEMADILNMTKFSCLDRNTAMLLRFFRVVECVCYNIYAKNKTARYNRKYEIKHLIFRKSSISYMNFVYKPGLRLRACLNWLWVP